MASTIKLKRRKKTKRTRQGINQVRGKPRASGIHPVSQTESNERTKALVRSPALLTAKSHEDHKLPHQGETGNCNRGSFKEVVQTGSML